MTLTVQGRMFAALLVLLYMGAVRVSSGLLFLVLGVLAGCYILDLWKVCGRERRPAGAGRCRFVFEEGERVNIPALGLHERIFSRGEYCFRNLSAARRGPLGLFARNTHVPGEGCVLITPKVFDVDPPPPGDLMSVIGGVAEGLYPSRTGGVFRGIRKYQPGDSIMRIHWKASAKGLGIMSREFAGEMAGCSAIWIDSGGEGGADGEVLDEACRLAGSLSLSAIDRKDAVEFIVWGEGKISGSGHLPGADEILQKLAAVRPRAPSGNYREKAAELAARLPSSSSHTFILVSAETEAVQFIKELSAGGKAVAVYLPDELASGGRERFGSFSSPPRVLPYPGLCKP